MRILSIFAFLAVFGLSAAGQTPSTRVVAVSIDGVVHPITVEIVSHAIEQAQSEHVELLLIRLNTPGGLLEATREIIQKLSASPIPVVTYVTPSGARAASAGFFLLEAGDIAAMSPGTNTGAASPVLLGQQMEETMRKKVENDAAALLRSMTTQRGRNSQLAETAVRDAKAFTQKEALDDKLIDLIASDEQQLFKQLDGREITRWDGHKQVLHLAGVIVVEAHLTLRERLMATIADPNIAFILLVLGALGIYVEFSSPGLIFPGVAGAILVLLGLSGLSILPINWVGVALLVLAVSLFVLEAKFTSHGILGIGGTLSMVLGAVLLINGPPELRIHWSTAISVAIPFALITMFLVSIVMQARQNKVLTGASGMIGEIGIARTALAPEGQVLVRGEYWDAVAEANVSAGARVRVKALDGLKLVVEQA
ncbi:MAG TPA: nodulation protein NfeD [Bryobacteraceae bacterium]|nr:nodulation protein NfeD [Bryobacteraceae bacterium]